MNTEYLIQVAQILARHRGLKLTTISTYVANDGKLLTRLRDGHDITMRRHARILQWFSDQWPIDLPWPPDIPRPAPSEFVSQPPKYKNGSRNGSATPAPTPAPDDPSAAVNAALTRKADAIDAMDTGAVIAAEEEAIAAAMALNAKGQIASADALCRALGVSRQAYYNVVRHYADGGAKMNKPPSKRRSATRRVLLALVAAGDARFQSRALTQAS